jgi:hypothetical protein
MVCKSVSYFVAIQDPFAMQGTTLQLHQQCVVVLTSSHISVWLFVFVFWLKQS